MWLTGRLTPDFKTIADFRKDNGPAIRAACRQFVALCRQLNLFAQAMVAIDGSKFKAVNTRDKNFTRGSIAAAHGAGRGQHRALPGGAGDGGSSGRRAGAKPSRSRLKDKIAALREQMRDVQGAGSRRARRARQADLADRSGRALDGDERQGHAASSATMCRPRSMRSIT